MVAERRSDLDRVYRGYVDERGETWSAQNPGNRAIAAERDAVVADLVSPVDPAWRVLDLGSGGHGSFGSVFAACDTVSVDLLLWRLAEAPEGRGPRVCGDGAALPFPAATFDVVLLSTVLSSVPAARIGALLAEVARVVVPGGLVVNYDMRWPNPANRAVHPVRRRVVVAGLGPRFTVYSRSVTLVPQLARRLGPGVSRLYPVLARIPGLRSHRIDVARRVH